MKKLSAILLFHIICVSLKAQEVQLNNYCQDCDRDLSAPISGLVVKTKLIPYCKLSGTLCTHVDSFDVQYKENTCPQKPPNQWVSTDNKCSNDPSTTPLVILNKVLQYLN